MSQSAPFRVGTYTSSSFRGGLSMRERLSLFIPTLVVLTVSVTRLYLGLHYLADILFAILVGALFVWAYARLFPYGAGSTGAR